MSENHPAALPETAEPGPPAEATPPGAAPAARRWRWRRLPVISFSLTIAAAGVALLAGILPARAAALTPDIDTAVVLLFVPLCVLVLGILAEAVRLSVKLRHGPEAVPLRRPLSAWPPANAAGVEG
jgi:hypothetical protein